MISLITLIDYFGFKGIWGDVNENIRLHLPKSF